MYKKGIDKLAYANYNSVLLEHANFFVDTRLADANKYSKKGGTV